MRTCGDYLVSSCVLLVEKLRELALFAGAGGGILGGKLLGWRTICAVEIDPYCIHVLNQRQDDGILDPFPIWDDIRTFDGKPWRGRVDVISGGFPCQDISIAGNGAGIDGERSGLWGEMARVIREVGPRYVFVENSPALTVRGLGVVLGGLAAMGFNAEWCVLGARHAKAPHERDRLFLLAHTDGDTQQGQQSRCVDDWPPSPWPESDQECEVAYRRLWSEDQPKSTGMANGVAHRVDRVRAIGNGQVPQVAALAFNLLKYRSLDELWAASG